MAGWSPSPSGPPPPLLRGWGVAPDLSQVGTAMSGGSPRLEGTGGRVQEEAGFVPFLE